MGTNSRSKIDNHNLEEWLRSTGFLFPTNELEIIRFNKLYANYDFKLKDASIDAKSIIEGNSCSNNIKVFKPAKNDELNSEIGELKMAARKGQEVPKHIIDKMMQKHRKNDDSKE
ncbi:MAG: hypothetical protein LBI82_02935 [Dysgonamonadaceae bacterium]|jgi:hypothetical protein|nr:hypothetical protein [Dysgonamonadaceae bacterium]